MARQPNVIIVLTDDQGYPPMGAHGHPFVQTPNLDRFHGESVRFAQFHTGTTCAPTRAGLLTGHYCNSTGVWHTIGGRSLLRRDEWSLATALAEAGYRTGLFGKWHLGDAYPYRPQDRGFQRVVCHGGGGISQQPDYWGNDYFDDTYLADGVPRPYAGYCTDVFFREALAFIEAQRDAPFFCFISTNAPHGPWNVEPRYRDLDAGHTASESYARFLGMITNIDENFGKLRERLRARELEDNTLLIFMSDNGQTGCADPQADIPISIGSVAEAVTTLRSHDLRNEQDHLVVWNQDQVRRGDCCHGWWEVMVEAAGEYEFELRRWPEEAGHRLQGGIEGGDVAYRPEGIQPGAEALYTGGAALAIDTAGLLVSGFPAQWVSVRPEDRGATLRLKLPAGPRHVRAQFSAAATGFYSSAYYVYVQRL